MSHTRRKAISEVSRVVKPYKRKSNSQLLKEFEVQYIATSPGPAVQ